MRSASLVAVTVLLSCSSGGPPKPRSSQMESAGASSARTNAVERPPSAPRGGGMWLPSQIPAQIETLRRLGLGLDPKELADPSSSVLGAIVQLSGCSAAFVSAEGLIATNHHCAVRALEYNSTPQRNLLDAGFLARTRAEEKTGGPSARLFLTIAVHDVTAGVTAALAAAPDDLTRKLALEKEQKERVAACESARKSARCQLVWFYEGASYALIERLELRDVRLVWAPPNGVGNFGGEVDNWRWPRHTGDVAFFRAYVDKDGAPADYAAENLPYRPSRWLRLADTPLAAGALVVVAGFPGHTAHFAASREVEEVMTWFYPRRLRQFDAYIAALEAASRRDAVVKIKASSWLRGFQNYRTKHSGELEGMQRAELLEKKRAEEASLAAPAITAALAELGTAFDEKRKTREADLALEAEVAMPRLIGAANRIVRMAEERARPDAEREPEYQTRNLNNLRDELKTLDRLYARALDESVLTLALERVLATPAAERSAALELVAGKDATPDSIPSAVSALYAGTKLGDAAVRLALFERASSAELARHPDRLIRLAVALRPLLRAAELRRKAFAGKLLRLKPIYARALLARAAGNLPSDANGTLRVTFGTLTPDPAAPTGTEAHAFTTVAEMVAKHRGAEPFAVPERVLTAARERRFGRYVDRALGDVPVNFLSDATITNGSSGSATLDARGKLVGLAFDGTYTSVASDWLVLPDNRAIHVDFRYVLWLLSEVERASELLRELGVEPG